MQKIKSVEEYIELSDLRKAELKFLRSLILESGLEEKMKWSMPTYTLDGKNVVGMAAFKSYVGLWFHQGVFLKDEKQVLINAQSGKTKALRQWRFNSLEEIENQEKWIRQYLQEAKANQKKGMELAVQREKGKAQVPPQLKKLLSSNPGIEKAFNKLSGAQQRVYCEFISEAKQLKTKERRLKKIEPLISAGKGLNDKYR